MGKKKKKVFFNETEIEIMKKEPEVIKEEEKKEQLVKTIKKEEPKIETNRVFEDSIIKVM